MTRRNSIRILILTALLVISGQGKAWIAFGFKSGMSRFDVARYLSDNETWAIADGARHTDAGPQDDRFKYQRVYFAKPQKLYLMQFRPGDSLEQFEQMRDKFEKRYGEPTPLKPVPDYLESSRWPDTEVAFIWDLNEYETILLQHDRDGTRAEFQDLSVCE